MNREILVGHAAVAEVCFKAPAAHKPGVRTDELVSLFRAASLRCSLIHRLCAASGMLGEGGPRVRPQSSCSSLAKASNCLLSLPEQQHHEPLGCY